MAGAIFQIWTGAVSEYPHRSRLRVRPKSGPGCEGRQLAEIPIRREPLGV